MFVLICPTWDFRLTFVFLLKLEGHGPSSDTPVDLSLQPRTNCKSETMLKILPDCMTTLWFRCLSLCSTERSGDKWVSPPHAARSPDSQHSHWGQKLNKTVKKCRDVFCACSMTVLLSCLLELRKQQCHKRACGCKYQPAWDRLVKGRTG